MGISPLCYKCVHHHIMAQASAHDKQMENLMRTEIFMLCIENRQFQCVDNAARRVDKPAGQQPEKGAFRKCQHDLPEGQHTDPAHRDVNQRRKPLRAVDPERVDENPSDRDTPDE